jgi:hypothetical protein
MFNGNLTGSGLEQLSEGYPEKQAGFFHFNCLTPKR